VGESLNDVLNPLLRTRGGGRSADEAEVAETFEEATRPSSKVGMPRPSSDSSRPSSDSSRPSSEVGTPRRATLSLQDLRVSFDTDAGQVRAVDGVSFDVQPGEVVAVVGESGSGKSVSARAVLGLLPSTAHCDGSATLDERELLGLSPGQLRPIRGDRIAMVFQEPSTALNPVYTIGWQLVEGI